MEEDIYCCEDGAMERSEDMDSILIIVDRVFDNRCWSIGGRVSCGETPVDANIHA